VNYKLVATKNLPDTMSIDTKDDHWLTFHGTNDPFNIENWYPTVQSVTMFTQFIDLTKEEALTLVSNHKFYLKDNNVLKKLAQKLDLVITPIVKRSEFAFIRISTCSPKDCVNGRWKPAPLSDDDMLKYIHSSIKALRVTCGDDAVQLLVQSERVYDDLQFSLSQDKYGMKIAVRDWCTDVQPEFEFRAFVYAGKMTCCTQYLDYYFNPDLIEKQDRILQLIEQCWNLVRNDIKINNYTIDFAVSNDFKRCHIIELNHLPPVAGTGLFIWDLVSIMFFFLFRITNFLQ